MTLIAIAIIITTLIIMNRSWKLWNMPTPNWNPIIKRVWWPWSNKWDDRKSE
jgi:hypothetical protein